MIKASPLILLTIILFGATARAAEPIGMCASLDTEKAKHPGDWAALTTDQWFFLSGIYAMNPLTPKGLPYGDKAILLTQPGKDGGIVVFVDGDLACTPMPVPQTLLKMLTDVAAGKINHEGNPL